MSTLQRQIKLTVCVLACAVAIFIGSSRPLFAEEFPVWWSPKLEVESLDKIGERLTRKFPLGGQIEARRSRDGVVETALMDSCATTMRLANTGFGAIQYGLQLAILAECRAIELLADIRPVERSFVHDFVLDETAIPFLPIMFSLLADCFTLRERQSLNADHAPLTDTKRIEAVQVLPADRLRFRTATEEITIEVLSRGDMTGDGLADLTVRLISTFFGGSGGGTSLFVVSRDGPQEVLYVVAEDAGNHVCRNYRV